MINKLYLLDNKINILEKHLKYSIILFFSSFQLSFINCIIIYCINLNYINYFLGISIINCIIYFNLSFSYESELIQIYPIFTFLKFLFSKQSFIKSIYIYFVQILGIFFGILFSILIIQSNINQNDSNDKSFINHNIFLTQSYPLFKNIDLEFSGLYIEIFGKFILSISYIYINETNLTNHINIIYIYYIISVFNIIFGVESNTIIKTIILSFIFKIKKGFVFNQIFSCIATPLFSFYLVIFLNKSKRYLKKDINSNINIELQNNLH